MSPHPVAVAADVDDVAVVQQTVDERRRHDLVADHAAPLLEPLVRGQHCRTPLVARVDPLECRSTTRPWPTSPSSAARSSTRTRPNNHRDETPTTTTIDVLLALAEGDITDVEAGLHNRGWTTTAIVPEGWLLRVAHPRGGRIDLVVSQTEYEIGPLARDHPVTVDNLHFKTTAVEDVVIHKLIANRYRDIADVESILIAKPDFDWASMSHWFDVFDLSDRYQRIEQTALNDGRIAAADTRPSTTR